VHANSLTALKFSIVAAVEVRLPIIIEE